MSTKTTVMEARREIALSPIYVPPCPLCSYLNRPDQGVDVIHGPVVVGNQKRTRFLIQRCCSLSDAGAYPTEQAAAAWWRDVRVNRPLDATSEEKRARTLKRLEFEGYEPPSIGVKVDVPAPVTYTETHGDQRALL